MTMSMGMAVWASLMSLILLATISGGSAWSVSPSRSRLHSRSMRAQATMDFGDSFYVSHDSLPPYGLGEDLPDGVYEISLQRPLGIGFEENDYPRRGVKVISLVSGSNAEKCGRISVGDQLVGVTGIRLVGAKFERQLFDCTKWDFDTVVDAIGSNEERFGCKDVVLQFQRGAPEMDQNGDNAEAS
mmetsp:Transcript_13858/g.35921  ORF Transcript_13858/g.35921 Transcript_13858/m.35921 type:complete len:186 (+) Transcript_13858:57-614(+)